MLQTENEEYDPIYSNELYIHGVAVNVIKSCDFCHIILKGEMQVQKINVAGGFGKI